MKVVRSENGFVDAPFSDDPREEIESLDRMMKILFGPRWLEQSKERVWDWDEQVRASFPDPDPFEQPA